MKIVILTEGGGKKGFGHISRCIALSQGFEKKGISPKIIINGNRSLENLLQGIDYKICDWLSRRIAPEIKDSDILIIDSYLADLKFYEYVSCEVRVAVFLDDNKRIDYPNGVVVNGSIYAEDLGYEPKEDLKYFLGTKYMPLRKEFWEVGRKGIKEHPNEILITFGGSDSNKLTFPILDIMSRKFPGSTKNVILGGCFRKSKDVERIMYKNTNIFCGLNSQEMKNIMLNSDIAISSGGCTLYELASVGLPTIAIAVAENQINNVKMWEKTGAMEYAGWWQDRSILENVLVKVKKILEKNIRASMSRKEQRLVDGRGAERVVQALLNYYKLKKRGGKL